MLSKRERKLGSKKAVIVQDEEGLNYGQKIGKKMWRREVLGCVEAAVSDGRSN